MKLRQGRVLDGSTDINMNNTAHLEEQELRDASQQV